MIDRQGLRGRQVPPIPPVYEEEEYADYGEVYQDYGNVEEEYPEVDGGNAEGYGGYGREEDIYERGRDENDRGAQEEENDQGQIKADETEGGETDDGHCGPECKNFLHELEHPKEHERCPNAGMVIDIWGYCR